MITKEQALTMYNGQEFYEVGQFGSDGRPVRWRVNGQVKTWKTRPSEFRVPIKHGMYEFAYLDERNARWFCLDEQEAFMDTEVVLSRRPYTTVYWRGPGEYALQDRTWRNLYFNPIRDWKHAPKQVHADHPFDLKGR